MLRYAYDWSLQVQASILLVHQTAVLAPVLTNEESRKAIARQANAEAMQLLQELRNSALPPDAPIAYQVSEEPLQSVLPRLLSEPYEHLVFVGLKGTGFFKKIFIGSTAVQVIDHSGNIVVALPGDMSRFTHEKIFVAVTEKHPLNEEQLKKFFGFIGEGATKVTFFHLAKTQEDAEGMEKQLSALAEAYDASYAIYTGENAFSDIKDVINNRIDEILVVQKGSRLLTDQLFRKFLINELVYEGKTPMVVLP